MAKQMLYLHWRAVRFGLVPFVIASFGLPLLAVQLMGGRDDHLNFAYSALNGMENFLPLFPALAAGIGFTLALSAWNWDHKGNHVYALSLPVSRWEYAMLKFGAGVVLALIPVGAFLAGSLLATWAVEMPAGLRGYPVEVTMRFLLAILTLYAMVFAMASGTIRTTVIVLSVLIGAPILASILFQFLGNWYPTFAAIDVGDALGNWLVGFGPFRVITGNWMLIDV